MNAYSRWMTMSAEWSGRGRVGRARERKGRGALGGTVSARWAQCKICGHAGPGVWLVRSEMGGTIKVALLVALQSHPITPFPSTRLSSPPHHVVLRPIYTTPPWPRLLVRPVAVPISNHPISGIQRPSRVLLRHSWRFAQCNLLRCPLSSFWARPQSQSIPSQSFSPPFGWPSSGSPSPFP